MPPEEPLRFADILTTSSAIANYLGRPEVTAEHVLDAVAILRGGKTMEDLGRGVSPLVPRPPGGSGSVDPAVRELVQRWFERLGSSANADLAGDELAAFVADLQSLASEPPTT